MTTGQKIKQARESTGLTQEETAEKLGIRTDTYRQYEYNNVDPSTAWLRRFLRATGVATLAVNADDEDPTEKPKKAKKRNAGTDI